MTEITSILVTATSWLLVPVLVALLAMTARCAMDLGALGREFWSRRWHQKKRTEIIDNVLLGKSKQLSPNVNGDCLWSIFVRQVKTTNSCLQSTMLAASEAELSATRRLARQSFGVRIGPMLGLMGTLIPLGPGMMSLSEGNIFGMGDQLAVAFSTTVLGLLIGGLSYTQLSIRRQWYARDLIDIELVHKTIETQLTPAPSTNRNQ